MDNESVCLSDYDNNLMGCASVNVLYTPVMAGIDSKKSTNDSWRLTYSEKVEPNMVR